MPLKLFKHLSIAAMVLWLAVLLPAHHGQHASARPSTAELAAGHADHHHSVHAHHAGHESPDHDSPDHDSATHDCAICRLASALTMPGSSPVQLSIAAPATHSSPINAPRPAAAPLPTPFDAHAPPRA